MRNCLIVLFICLTMSCTNLQEIRDEEGNLVSRGRLVEDQKEGTWVNYNSNGDTTSVEVFSKGELLTKTKYSSFGISLVENFSGGKKNGPFKVYWQSGGVHIEGVFKNDSLDGVVTNYYQNGSIEQVARYKNGKPFGEYRYYYDDGVIQVEADNFSNGPHHIYDSLGNYVYTVVLKDFVSLDTLYDQK